MNVEAERTVNLYPEIIDAGTPSNNMWLRRRPGYAVFTVLDSGLPVRGLFYQDGRCFAVSGNKFYEVFANGTNISRGPVAQDDNPAYIISNGQIGGQLLIISGLEGYIFTLATNVLSGPIAAPGFPPNPSNAVFADSYFLVLFNDFPKFAFSALADGTSWDALDVAQKSQTSDNLLAMVYDHKELWLVGSKTIEIWFDTGDANNPWTPQPILIESGVAAPNSICKGDDSVFWLKSGDYGALSVMRAQGYSPIRISTHAVEQAINGYSRFDDASAFFYEDEGHGFYVLTFLQADATWVYDVRTQQWHERGFWNAARGEYNADLGRSHCWAPTFMKHLVGSRIDGNVFHMTGTVAEDVGNPIRWMRRAPQVTNENKRLFIQRFELAMRTAVGSAVGPGTDPHIFMRISRDSGNTWSNEKRAALGPLLQYQRRVFWTRLGMLRTGLVEVAGDDPLFTGIYDAYLDVAAGVS